MTAKEVVLAYWKAMESNDFHKGSEWLSEGFECYWPQSSELIIGRKNFAEINTNYPADGPWRFCVNSIVCEGNKVVTDVDITDGSVNARAITFHTVENGLITRQTEFWPDNYNAPKWRRQWVKIVKSVFSIAISGIILSLSISCGSDNRETASFDEITVPEYEISIADSFGVDLGDSLNMIGSINGLCHHPDSSILILFC